MYGTNVCMRLKPNISRGGTCYLNMETHLGGTDLDICNLAVSWYWDAKGLNPGIRNLGWTKDSYTCH